MSSTPLHQRTFALVMALLFLATSVAGGALVIWQINQDNKQAALTEELTKQAADIKVDDTCTIGQVPGVETLPAPEVYVPPADVTELETTDITVGDGDEVVSGNCVIAKYYGTLAANGEVFDENFTTDQGLRFNVGAGSVIEGWDQGLLGMRVGGVRRLVIPSDMAYGENAAGSIPANSDLVFVVKVLEVVK